MQIKEEIFIRFKSGFKIGFEEVFDHYYKKLVVFSMRFGVSQSESEDIVMEILYKTWNLREDIDSPSKLNSLLYISVKNRTLNALKYNQNKEPIVEDIQSSHTKEFYDYAMEEELMNALNKAINELSPQAKGVIKHLIEGKTLSEISQIMKISESSVKTYKGRAIALLRDKLSNYQLLYIIIIIGSSKTI